MDVFAKRGMRFHFLGTSALKACGLVCALTLSAYLMAVAIASPAHSWLGWVTLLPLFFAIRRLSPVGASGCGAFWGLALFFLASMHGGARIPFDVESAVLLSAIPALYAFIGGRLTRSVGFSPYLLALGWIGVELSLRPLGLHYGLLAGTQGDGVAIRLVGSFAGYALVAFLVAYVNAALLSILSKVRVSVRQARLVPAGSDPKRRVLPLVVPSYLFFQLCSARPRAPPA